MTVWRAGKSLSKHTHAACGYTFVRKPLGHRRPAPTPHLAQAVLHTAEWALRLLALLVSTPWARIIFIEVGACLFQRLSVLALLLPLCYGCMSVCATTSTVLQLHKKRPSSAKANHHSAAPSLQDHPPHRRLPTTG